MAHPPTLRTFHYKHTAYAVVETADGRALAVDAGWPSTFLEYARALKSAGGQFERITWAVVTHFHPDHAGLVGEFQARGIECLAVDAQARAVPAMERLIARSVSSYRPVRVEALTPLASTTSRVWLAARGIGGAIVATPGHSDDSVSLVLDTGEALVGDLTLPSLLAPEDVTARESWMRLSAAGGRRILHAHAGTFELTAAPDGALTSRGPER